MKLSDKQERFCREYIIDLNATQACIRAGYSENSASGQGSRLLANAKVSARIKELKAKRADELELDAYWVLKRLKDVSDRSMQAEPVMQWDHEAKEMVPTGEYEFDSTGANKATELIGKHIGMFDPKLNVQLKSLEIKNKKSEKEIEFLEERIKLLRGQEKDTSLLETLLSTVKGDD